MPSWTALAESDSIKALDDEQYSAAKRMFFDTHVAKDVPPEYADAAWAQFDSETPRAQAAKKSPGIIDQAVGAVKGIVDRYRETESSDAAGNFEPITPKEATRNAVAAQKQQREERLADAEAPWRKIDQTASPRPGGPAMSRPQIAPPTRADREAVLDAEDAATPRSWTSAINDTLIDLGQGLQNIPASIPKLLNPAGDAAQHALLTNEANRAAKSPAFQVKLKAADARIRAAASNGLWSELEAALAEYAGDPALATHLVAQTLPSTIGVLGPAKVAQALSILRGGTGTTVGLATASGANAVMTGGDARSHAYEDLYRVAIEQGYSKDEARKIAEDGSLSPAAVGLVTGAAGGAFGAEAGLLGGHAAKTAIGRGAKALGGEIATELPEELLPLIETNRQAQQLGDDRSLLKDVPTTAVQTAVGVAGPGTVGAIGAARNDTSPEAQLGRALQDQIDGAQFDQSAIDRFARAQMDPNVTGNTELTTEQSAPFIAPRAAQAAAPVADVPDTPAEPAPGAAESIVPPTTSSPIADELTQLSQPEQAATTGTAPGAASVSQPNPPSTGESPVAQPGGTTLAGKPAAEHTNDSLNFLLNTHPDQVVRQLAQDELARRIAPAQETGDAPRLDNTIRRITGDSSAAVVPLASLPSALSGQRTTGGFITREEALIANAIAGVGGHRIVLFGSERQDAPDGVVIPSTDKQNIFLNVRGGGTSLYAVAGHEVGHHIKQQAADQFKTFIDVVNRVSTIDLSTDAGILAYAPTYWAGAISDQDVAAARAAGKTDKQIVDDLLARAGSGYTRAAVAEEFYMDVFGNRMREPGFYRSVIKELARTDVSLLQKLRAVLDQIIEAVKQSSGRQGFAADKFIRDLEAVRQEAARVYAAYASRQDRLPRIQKMTPAELLATKKTHPDTIIRDMAEAELKRREIDGAYAERESRKDAERAAIQKETKEDQVSQAQATTAVSEFDTPADTAVGKALAEAKPDKQAARSALAKDAQKMRDKAREQAKARSAQVEDNEQGLFSPKRPEFKNQTLPTRWPSSKKLDPQPTVDDDMITDLATLKLDQTQYRKAVEALLEEPGMHSPDIMQGSLDEKAEHVIDRMVDNLVWLHDQIPQAIRERSRLWYDGARAIAERWAERYEVSESQAAGILAVLSPQKDWFMNVTMAERVLDVLSTKQDHKFDKDMEAAAFGFLTKDSLKDDPASRRNLNAFHAIRGKTLGQVVAHGDLRQAGIWIRAYDEAYHDAKHAIVTPEGGFAEDKTTVQGDPTLRAWGDFTAIGKAASIFVDGTPQNISTHLGNEHKVRNFYNNIYAPKDPRFATIDTHAVAADLLRPLAGADKPVADNFGKTGGTNMTGLSGTYALHYEAYRRAAEQRGLLPREMQSITWEAVRGLFTEGYKGKKDNVRAIDAIWKQVDAGKLSVADARAQILEHTGGIAHPDWWNEGNAEYREVLRDKTYLQERKPFLGAKMTFEVAPDPNNADLKARWDAMSPKAKHEVSDQIAWKIAAKALASFGDENMKGELRHQLGGYLADTNPSISIWFNKRASGTKIDLFARVLGYALRQDSMMRTSPRPFKDGSGKMLDPKGAIVIARKPGDSAQALYAAARTVLDKKGQPIVRGHTTNDTHMVIIHDAEKTKVSTEDLARRIDQALGGVYDVRESNIYVEFIEKGKGGAYALPRKGSDPARSSARTTADQLRAEADVLFEQLVPAARYSPGRGYVGSGSHGVDSEAGGRVDSRAQSPGRIDLTGVHFSKEHRARLLGSYFGTGTKSQEVERILAATDTRIKARIYAYINEGRGVFPEEGVGSYPHKVRFENLYDMTADPLEIRRKSPRDLNAMESMVLDAGFDGYYSRAAFGNQGVAILMGKAALQGIEAEAAPIGYRGKDIALPPAEELTDNAKLIREISGSNALPGGKFDAADFRKYAPDLFEKLKATGAQIPEGQALYKGEYAQLVPVAKRSTKRLAPNGKPSRLTEAQWLQVRTPEFKKWFGDWEKYATLESGVWADGKKEVSKVVDRETGEPLVVYHGSTDAGFSVFEPERNARGTPGSFFTDRREIAMTYAGRRAGEADIDPDGDRSRGIYSAFLNIRDPHEEYFEGANWDGSREGQYVVMDENGDQLYADDGTGYFLDRDAAEALAEANPGSEVQDADEHYQTTNGVVEEAARYKKDGAIIRDVVDNGSQADVWESSDVFVAFDAAQIKSAVANQGTFSPADPDIRRSTNRSHAGYPQASWDALRDFWSLMSIHKDIFQMPTTKAAELPKAFAEVVTRRNPDVTLEQVSDETRATDDTIDLDFTRAAPGETVWAIMDASRARPDIPAGYIHESAAGDVWISVAGFESGTGGGAAVYSAVGQYAANAGKRFIGDPAGFTQARGTEARLGEIRRVEHLISQILRTGKSQHVTLGDAHKLAPQWREGDTAGNLDLLLKASYDNYKWIFDAVPALKGVRFDVESEQFIGKTGQVVSDASLRAVLGRDGGIGTSGPGVRGSGIGERVGVATAKRAIVARSILEGMGSESADRLVAAIDAKLDSAGLGRASGVRGIQYSLNRDAIEKDVSIAERGSVDAKRAALGGRKKVFSVREAEDLPGLYHVRAQLTRTGTRNLPVTSVKSPADAARVFAGLSRFAVEHLDGLVTDKNGKPLAIIGAFKGAPAQAPVYVSTVMMELARIKGAANLWLSHNHPSGKAEMSSADLNVARTFSQLLAGTNVAFRGMSAMARRGNVVAWADSENNRGEVPHGEPAPHTVPVVERELLESNPGDLVSSPSEAKRLVRQIAGSTPGVVFLNAQNEVSAFVPFDPEHMGELRKGDRLMRLFRAASTAGAQAAIVAMPDNKVARTQYENVAGALNSIDVRVLDGIYYQNGEPEITSLAEKGLDGHVGMAFRSPRRQTETPEFKQWFGKSKVVDANGRPLIVYRGEHGDSEAQFHSRAAALSFGSKAAANTYAMDPNNSRDTVVAPRVIPVYLRIENPVINTDEDPFVEGADLEAKLGKGEARRILEKFSDYVENTGNWQEDINPDNAYAGVEEYLKKHPDGHRDLYFEAYPWLDDATEVAKLKAAGFDGAIHGGSGETAGEREYKVFDERQVKSAIGNNGEFSLGNPDIRRSPMRHFFSPLAEAVRGARIEAQPGAQWMLWLAANKAKLGLKDDEIQWSGINDWLELQGKAKVSKADLLAYLDGNGVRIDEVTRGRIYAADGSEIGSSKETKYSDYQLPGGKNYRELLLTLPAHQSIEDINKQREALGHPPLSRERYDELRREGSIASDERQFTSNHWSEPNILAHIRFNERTDADGARVLFIEEIQSDWGQQGKKQGFDTDPRKTKPLAPGEYAEFIVRMKKAAKEELMRRTAGKMEPEMIRGVVDSQPLNQVAEWAGMQDEHAQIVERSLEDARSNQLIPSAPFVTDTKAWVALAVKRMIAYAVEHDFDKVAFINGEQSAGRYDLSKRVRSVEYKPETSELTVYALNGDVLVDDQVAPENIEDFIGKDPAKRLLASEPVTTGAGKKKHVIEGGDLKVGGSGMKAFYDQIVPRVVNDVLKKLGGGKIGEVEFSGVGKSKSWPPSRSQQPGFEITPVMREKVAAGMPLFSPARIARASIAKLDAAIDGLSNLPDQFDYLKDRYETLGRIARVDEIIAEIKGVFKGAPQADKQAVYAYLTTKGASPTMIGPQDLRAGAVKIKQTIDYVGDALVARGLLDPAARAHYKDSYLPRMYLKHLLTDQEWAMIGAGKKPSDMGYLKHRKDIPQEVRELVLGEVTDPAFLASQAIGRAMRDIALLDWLDRISQKQAWVFPGVMVDFRGKRVSAYWLKAEAERIEGQKKHYTPANQARADQLIAGMRQAAQAALGALDVDHNLYRQIPDTNRYGLLRGLYVRKEIYADIMGLNSVVNHDPTWFEQFFGIGHIGTRLTQYWKFSKVAANPPGQVRNFISNMVMLNLSGVALHRMPVRFVEAVRDIVKNGPYWKIAKKYGVTEATFTAQELYRIKQDLVEIEGQINKLNPLTWIKLAGLHLMDKLSDAYQFSEALGKTMKIIDEMKAGKSEAEAALEAQRWLFDYSLVPQWVRVARNSPVGMPFITYQVKVLPRLLEVATTAPWRLLPYMALFYGMQAYVASVFGVDDDDLDKLKKSLPMWLQNRGHTMVLPFKDADGRVQVADVGYFFPWTFYTQIAKHTAEGEVGKVLKEDIGGLFSAPVIGTIQALMANYDPFTKRPIMADGDPTSYQAAAFANYLWDFAVPPIISSHGVISPMGLVDKQYGGKLWQAQTGTTNKFGDPKATTGQALAAGVGFNFYGMDPEHTRATNLQVMMRKVTDAEARLKQKLMDRGLTADQRAEAMSDYRARMLELADEAKTYAEESRVPDALKVRK